MLLVRQVTETSQASFKGRRCCLLMEVSESFVAISSPSQLLWITLSSYYSSLRMKISVSCRRRKYQWFQLWVAEEGSTWAKKQGERKKSCGFRKARERSQQGKTDGREFKAHADCLFIPLHFLRPELHIRHKHIRHKTASLGEHSLASYKNKLCCTVPPSSGWRMI